MSQTDRQSPARAAENRVQELRASAHLMTLDSGVFCLVHGSPKPADQQLTGVRVSAIDPTDSTISIATFRPDGWLTGGGDSALIRVLSESAQILITIYQPVGSLEGAPKLRVLRLSEAAAEGNLAAPGTAPAAIRKPTAVLSDSHDMIAHIQRTGDVGKSFGDWMGEPGSEMAIEGFSLTAPEGLEPGDITYQAVLGRGWLSPWNEAGQFCGSRGMALPILGFKLKLSEAAAKRFTLSISASFLDGTKLDDLGSDESVEAPSLSPLEAFLIDLKPKVSSKKVPEPAKPASRPALAPAPAPAPVVKAKLAPAPAPVAKPAARPVVKTPTKPTKRSR
ncbi:hypothetical protein ACELLULO517_01945 [Acidisoma cellulosilytica]|uniref:Uncharacterized protein n=1 Tax=Acidisoma cellulosilyticum TaxID=2802395 RepID=A0A963YY87_9PROT|nr:hypothetical protein [Acidisoma cellulosilyticum]MCB8878979.1 hypothetical protein [Acidisoma cellulosilyticum]